MLATTTSMSAAPPGSPRITEDSPLYVAFRSAVDAAILEIRRADAVTGATYYFDPGPLPPTPTATPLTTPEVSPVGSPKLQQKSEGKEKGGLGEEEGGVLDIRVTPPIPVEGRDRGDVDMADGDGGRRDMGEVGMEEGAGGNNSKISRRDLELWLHQCKGRLGEEAYWSLICVLKAWGDGDIDTPTLNMYALGIFATAPCSHSLVASWTWIVHEGEREMGAAGRRCPKEERETEAEAEAERARAAKRVRFAL